MTVTKQTFETAQAAGAALRQHGHATSARYDRAAERLIVSLHNGVELAVPVHLLKELSGVDPDALSGVEITPSGLGLHWPTLDADVYIPTLLGGVFGSRSWMASEMGTKGGKSSSPAKATAARANGQKGGRPRKRSAS